MAERPGSLVERLKVDIQDHLDQIPPNTGKAMFRSAVISGIVVVLITGAPAAAVAASGVAALAVAIDALLNPLFEKYFATEEGEGRVYSVLKLTAKHAVAITGAACAATALLPVKVNIISAVIVQLVINYFTVPEKGAPAHATQEYWAIPNFMKLFQCFLGV